MAGGALLLEQHVRSILQKMLEVRRLSFAYPQTDSRTILNDISFTLPEGTITGILGPSGCGKTTLLHIIAELIKKEQGSLWEGSITLDGETITKGDRRVGVMPQHYGLLPWFTAGKNLELGLILRKVAKASRRELCSRAARRFGIDDILERYPCSLSGGEQQRVAIARLLVTRPRLLLLDEPFSSLDAITREELQEYLLRSRDPDASILLVTHSIEEAAFLADRVIIIAPRGGSREMALPLFSEEQNRSSDTYYRRCRMIRALMEELWET